MNLNTDKNDSNVTIDELKGIIKKFCEDRDWDQFHNPKDLSVAVITEASELLEIFRFKSDEEAEGFLSNPGKREAVADELADILYFVLRFAQKYDIDLSSEFYRKMELNNQKYPQDKFKGSNKKYSEA